MSRRAIKIGLTAVLMFLILTVAVSQIKTPAHAGDSRLQLTYDDAPTKCVAGGQEVTRTVYVDEQLYPDLHYITYNVVTSTSNDIMYERLQPVSGAVSGENLTTERQNVTVHRNDLVPTGASGKKAYAFTVKSDHCCAFIFTVYYDTGEETDKVSYDSKVLYLQTVDSRPPKVEVKSINRFLNSVTCSFDDRSPVCASSGTKSFTVYRTNMDTGVKTEFLTSTDINRNTASFTIDFGSGHYNYYVTATDYVNNTSEELLVAMYDVDELIRSADNAFNTISSSPESWSEGFKNKLNNAYSEYTIKRNDSEATDDEKEAAAEALSAVLDEYKGYIADKLNDRKDVTFEADNASILSSGLTVKNLYKACDFVKFGEKGTVVIGVYKADREKENDASSFEPCDMKITDVYAFSVRVFATEQGNVNKNFSVPLELALSVGEYEQIAAVQVVTKDNEASSVPCYIKEYTNGNLVFEVENTSGTVYLYVSAEQKKDNKLLYLLFLLVIPVASGATCLVIYHKRKKAKENNNGRKEADHQ